MRLMGIFCEVKGGFSVRLKGIFCEVKGDIV